MQRLGKDITGNRGVKSYTEGLRAPVESCEILGVNIAVTNYDDCAKMLVERIDEISGQYVCFSNVHTTIMSQEDESYKLVQNSSYISVPDGDPLAKTAYHRGNAKATRIAAGDLMDKIFRMSEVRGLTHFFYGSSPETLAALGAKLRELYPELEIKGMFSPPFGEMSKEEDARHVSMINAAAPDFIWVGLGAPKQEKWMFEHRGKVTGLMLGVGACFDYYAGNIKRAPMWMQNASLEWLYRLMQEPSRLFKRYMKTNWKFIHLVNRENRLQRPRVTSGANAND